MKIGIVGAGATGLTAGYYLAKAGHKVSVFEAEDQLGGLAGAIPVGEKDLDKYYHHIFTRDLDFLQLIQELQLDSKLMWKAPSNGIYINHKLYPITTPKDLLLFKELKFIDRIKMGLMAYRAQFVKDWKKLEFITAKEWIIKKSGQDVYAKIWAPLLKSKFDTDAEEVAASWIWNKFKLRFSSRAENISQEMLGYLDGSFKVLYQTLADKIVQLGGKVQLGQPVTQISPGENTTLVISGKNNSQETFDKIIATTAPEILINLVPTLQGEYRNQLAKIDYKANICMLLELKKSLSNYYWITVADEKAPFVLVIEHTNLIPDKGYKNHIYYLSRYLDENNPLFHADETTVRQSFFSYLEKMFPSLKEEDIANVHIFKARYAQPVIKKEYSKMIPDFNTPLKNLYLASMSQIYPEDRGQNYSIRMGKELAQKILQS